MRVPDLILECVAFLGDVITGGTDDFNHIATAFFVAIPSTVPKAGDYHYIVTAKHCVNQKSSRLLVNTIYGFELLHPSEDSDMEPWTFHPFDQSADIAVTALEPSPLMQAHTIPVEMLLPAEMVKRHIGIGDEVFFPGLFWGATGRSKNTPILRMGNVAMLPD